MDRPIGFVFNRVGQIFRVQSYTYELVEHEDAVKQAAAPNGKLNGVVLHELLNKTKVTTVNIEQFKNGDYKEFEVSTCDHPLVVAKYAAWLARKNHTKFNKLHNATGPIHGYDGT